MIRRIISATAVIALSACDSSNAENSAQYTPWPAPTATPVRYLSQPVAGVRDFSDGSHRFYMQVTITNPNPDNGANIGCDIGAFTLAEGGWTVEPDRALSSCSSAQIAPQEKALATLVFDRSYTDGIHEYKLRYRVSTWNGAYEESFPYRWDANKKKVLPEIPSY